jgi:hypothetical protein
MTLVSPVAERAHRCLAVEVETIRHGGGSLRCGA